MIFKISSSKNKELEEFYEKSMKDLGTFFGVNWKYNRPRLMLVRDRTTINNLRDQKTEDWVVGWVNKGDFYVLDRNNYEKESCHKYSKKEYFCLIKHELAHLFSHILSRNTHNPKWLWEGVATYVSGQNELKKPVTKFHDFLKFYTQSGKGIYRESGFAVELLVKKFGKQKLLRLIKSLPKANTKIKFNKLFKKIYGKNSTYKFFNELLKDDPKKN